MKKATTLVLLLFVLFSFNLTADYNPLFIDYSEPRQFEFKDRIDHIKNKKSDVPFAPERIERPYDVLSYEIFLDWYDPFIVEEYIDDEGNSHLDGSWQGINEIILVVKDYNIESIELDAPFLEFEKVFVDNTELTDLDYKSFEPVKTIPLNSQANIGDTVKLSIHYKFNDGRNIGFYLYPKGHYVGYNNHFDDSVYVEERVAYTMNEPQDARHWLPCNDHPHDKALFEIHVRLPKGYNAVSNGLLIDEYEYDDNSNVFIWKHDYPMSTYLLAVNASKFTIFNDWYKRVSNPEDSIEVVYYVWEKDFLEERTDGAKYNAKNSFKNMIPMMERFSEFFVEYPFDKYGMVAVQPYAWGGMEHQSITTINRAWLRGNSDAGIAHELVHQWLGDMITCDSWADLWINEGGATWSEAVWSYFWGGDNAYNNTMMSKRWGYLYYGNAKYTTAAYDVPTNQLFSYSITYCKSAWIYHMLYKMLGEEAFKQILRNMLNEYAYQSVSSQKFINFVKNSVEDPPDELEDILQTPPISIDEYFEQWLFQRGHPIYNMIVNVVLNSTDNQKYDVNITMEQTQDFPNVPEVFKVPLNFYIVDRSSGEPVYHEAGFFNDSKVQTFTATYDFIPDTVLFDFTLTLAEVDTTYYQITSVEDGSNDYSLSLFPNPVNAGSDLKIHYLSDLSSQVNIIITDMIGNIIYKSEADLSSSKANYFNINTDQMSSGVYFVHVRSGDKQQIRKFTVVK